MYVFPELIMHLKKEIFFLVHYIYFTIVSYCDNCL